MNSNASAPRTVDSPSEFAHCREQFFATDLSDTVLRWCFPGVARHVVEEQSRSFRGTEDFQRGFVNPMLQRILRDTSQGLSISGLDQLALDRKYLFISNHRCIVTDAALVSLTLLASGRGTCKVCVGDNLMRNPGVSELMLLLNGVVITRSGERRKVYANAKKVSAYLARQIEERRYSIWLSQSPGRTKDGNDHTDPAIIKMLTRAAARTRADFEKLHIVPVAISYELEPCATYKARETWIKRSTGAYQKLAGEDVAQIRDSLVAEKGRVHLAFGEEIRLEPASQEDVVQELARKIDAQIWGLYRCWDSNLAAHALLQQDLPNTAYAKSFLAKLDSTVATLGTMGLHPNDARATLLQMYAQPVFNAQRAEASQACRQAHSR